LDLINDRKLEHMSQHSPLKDEETFSIHSVYYLYELLLK